MSVAGLTPEQAQAVEAPGSVAVVAGAGTGKTKMLAHRYLRHLESGLSPLEVVAVTFTEKAADELRSRIRSLVREERPLDRRSRVELEAAQISTIHALAARVCRDHPDEAEVAPDFTVLDDVEGALWHAEQLEEAIAALPPEVVSAVPVYVLRTVLGALVSDPLAAGPALERGPDDWRAMLAEEHRAAYERIAADSRWREWRAVLSAHAGAEGDKKEIARRACLAALTALEDHDPVRASELANLVDLRGGKKDAWQPGALEAVKEVLGPARDAIKAECEKGVLSIQWGAADDALAAMLPHIRTAYGLTSARFEAARREARVLGFADLELHALRALAHEHVRRHYRRRWRAVLVDEFQDTNPVQALILEHLMEGSTFTVVGDEKQSIYGFRGADVEVFRRFRDRIVAAGGQHVELTSTFRAHAGLTVEQEPVFAALLRGLHGPLRAVRSAPARVGSYMQFHACVGRGNSRVRRLNEAHLLAGLIRDLVATGTPVADPETGQSRPVRFGDVAVLARGSAPFETFAAVLPALGVPAVEVAGGDLLETREAKDGAAALRFLADQDDSIALVALLRSPFFAVDDAALARFAATLPRPNRSHLQVDGGSALPDAGTAAEPRAGEREIGWWEHLLASEPGGELARARSVIQDVLAQRWDVVPSRLLQSLDEATGYSAVVANLSGGRRRLADWRAFLSVVRELEGWHRDAFTVARQLRRIQAAGASLPRPVLQAGDAVTLTTVHRSKGLEWPVVFVADLSYEGAGDDTSFVLDAEHGLGVRLAGEEGDSPDPVVLRLLLHRRALASEDEARRLLYVALTRARDRLYLNASERGKGNLAFLEPALADAGIECREVPLDEALAFPDAPPPAAADHGLVAAD